MTHDIGPHHGHDRFARQRAHQGPAFTLYPRKPTPGWAYVVGALALGAFAVALMMIGGHG